MDINELPAQAVLTKGSSIQQQADAWMAVHDLLSEVMPGWHMGNGTGRENALAAIRALSDRERQAGEAVAEAVADVTNTGFVYIKVLQRDAIKFGDKLYLASTPAPKVVQAERAVFLAEQVQALNKMWNESDLESSSIADQIHLCVCIATAMGAAPPAASNEQQAEAPSAGGPTADEMVQERLLLGMGYTAEQVIEIMLAARAAKCPMCGGAKVIGTPGAPCPGCKLFDLSAGATLPPASKAEPVAPPVQEREALLCEVRDKAASLLRHYGGFSKTASKLRELIDETDREIDELRAAQPAQQPEALNAAQKADMLATLRADMNGEIEG